MGCANNGYIYKLKTFICIQQLSKTKGYFSFESDKNIEVGIKIIEKNKCSRNYHFQPFPYCNTLLLSISFSIPVHAG